ncbi:hypothetical protein MNBD_ALPHA04-2253 [hydrothermal vent metagenome]|uniref:Putative zinc-finger domain-containing protein n=1 Tax=hydrothermal vent metagenome TaxID=652676 RepID=A0A3B0T597_9ZZZZ
MKCHEAEKLLDAYADRELSGQDHDLVRAHLDHCGSCPDQLAEIDMVRVRLRALPQFALPESLTARIEEMLDGENDGGASPAREWLKIPLLSHLAAACLGALIFFGVTRLPVEVEPFKQMIVSAHVRSLETGELVQVAAADTHTVGPWFAGKVSYAPPVTDLSARGFPLLGGRVDKLDGEKVAVLVYGRRAHKINLYVLPGSGDLNTAPAHLTRRGFNLVGWSQDGFDYWAVSDLAADELNIFATLIMSNN